MIINTYFFPKNFFFRWYLFLIKVKSLNPPEIRYEKHHYYPKSIFKEAGKNNTIKLSFHDHIVAHYLLWRGYQLAYGNTHPYTQKMAYAIYMMTNCTHSGSKGTIIISRSNIDIKTSVMVKTVQSMIKIEIPPEKREAFSNYMINLWKDEEFRKKRRISDAARWAKPEEHEMNSKRVSAYFQENPSAKEKVSEHWKEFYADPINKKIQSERVAQSWVENRDVHMAQLAKTWEKPSQDRRVASWKSKLTTEEISSIMREKASGRRWFYNVETLENISVKGGEEVTRMLSNPEYRAGRHIPKKLTESTN